MRFKGTLTQWDEARGFGFIEPAEGGDRVFCHARAFRDRDAHPSSGIRVTYSLGRDEQGRPRAEDAWRSGSERTLTAARSETSLRPARASTVSLGFFLLVAVLAVTGRLSWVVVPWYLALSAVTFVVYGIDKNSAQRNGWRVPERILQFLAFTGGWPGAWIAQQVLRHKTSKRSFQIEFWICVIVNLLLLAALVWQGGELREGLQEALDGR